MTEEKKQAKKEQTTPGFIAVPEPLVKAVLDYLAKHPFYEVNQMISALTSCRKLIVDLPKQPSVVTNNIEVKK